MRQAIGEFLDNNDKEKQELWNNATFVFDTNILLDLYRYSKKTRDILLETMSKFSNRIWMPKHTAVEYMNNRPSTIIDTVERYDQLHKELEKFVNLCVSTLRMDEVDAKLSELQDSFSSWLDENKEANLFVQKPSEDDILDKLLSLYDGKVGTGFSEEELQKLYDEGEERYKKQIPPGFKDIKKEKNKYGDLINWKEILRYSKTERKNIIYVMRDLKEDWWYEYKGKKISPRVELKREFLVETGGMQLHIYSLENFINRMNFEDSETVDQSVINEVKNVLQSEENEESKLSELVYDGDLDGVSSPIQMLYELHEEISKLEEQNRKRKSSLARIEKKYRRKDMPEHIAREYRSTMSNMSKCENKIHDLKIQYINLHEKGVYK